MKHFLQMLLLALLLFVQLPAKAGIPVGKIAEGVAYSLTKSIKNVSKPERQKKENDTDLLSAVALISCVLIAWGICSLNDRFKCRRKVEEENAFAESKEV